MAGAIGIGIVVASLAAAALVPAWGWPALMYAGGAFALALAPFVARLPGGALQEAPRLANARPPLRALAGREWRGGVVACLFAIALVVSVSFFLNFWMPSLLMRARGDMRSVALATALAQSMSFVGSVAIGRAMDRFGLRALEIACLGAALALLLVVAPAGGFVPLVAGLCALCFLVNGAFGGLIALPVTTLPRELRATALGVTLGLGRLVGGMAGPWAGGELLAHGLSMGWIAAAFAPPLLLAAMLVHAIRRAHG